MKLTKLYVNDQAKHVVLPMVMGHAANKLYINLKKVFISSFINKDLAWVLLGDRTRQVVLKSVEITNKMQPCNRIYYSKVYWRINMFRAAHRSSSGAPNCICSLWFIYICGDRPLSRLGRNWVPTQPGQQPVTTCVYKPKAGNTIWSSWWWVLCRLKHVEPSINFRIINSITRLHLVGYF